MNQLFDLMLKRYKLNTLDEKNNAIKEIIQEVVLCGLSRTNFFDKAVFYGGTALRIFYGLDRFSEDLDFSLINVDANFNLETYFPTIEKEIQSLGLNLKIEEKIKTNETSIKSAFLKGNTKELLFLFYSDNELVKSINPKQTIKIKFEIDINPPAFATYEYRYSLLPFPYRINLYDTPSLFAGKIHAVICRAWKTRIKGRDLYDYIFYLQNNSSINLKHLNERLKQSKFIDSDKDLNLDELKQILYDKFDNVNFQQAKEDVKQFINDSTQLDLWNADFFKQMTLNLKSVN